MSKARYKLPDPDYPDDREADRDIEYVVNPLGAVWGVEGTHPSVELAHANDEGWRLASDDQIKAHVKKTGDWLPSELEAKPEPEKRGPGRPPSLSKLSE